jgi:hypothetical protein
MKRALVVGSQLGGLQGVENDTRGMQHMLETRGFTVELRTGDRATRAGILTGYDRLITDSRSGDAAVIYYSGHGFYSRATQLQHRAWQCIAPTDLYAGSADDWRGITAWEISIKLAQLTARTRNVTVILDACHSSQMFRDAAVHRAIPRALPHPVQRGFEAHVSQLRSRYGESASAMDELANPDVVRLVACGQLDSAYEHRGADGKHHGAFTRALLDVLHQVGSAEVSWAALAGGIRDRVLSTMRHQRPDLEGPIRRRLFSLVEDDDRGIVPIRRLGDGFELAVGELTGATVGDVYGVVPVDAPQHDARAAIAEVELVEVFGLVARAQSIWARHTVPRDVVAVPITRRVARRAVAVVASVPARSALEAAIAGSPTLRIARADETAVLATVRLVGTAMTIDDDYGAMFPVAEFPREVHGTIKNLANLGVAQAVRSLDGEHGVRGEELDIEFGMVEHGQLRKLADHGAAVGLRDRLYVRITSRSRRRLFVHVFNVGVRGKVTLLTEEPAGVALDDTRRELVLGEGDRHTRAGAIEGLRLYWPEGLPRDGVPRVDELVVIATTTATDLRCFETREFLPVTRGEPTPLQQLLAQLHSGAPRAVTRGPADEGYLIKRLSYLLHPRDAAIAGLVFEVDDNPSGQAAARDPEAWIAPDRAAVTRSGPPPAAPSAPQAIAIRIADLVVNDTRAWFATDIRIDALICTRSRSRRPGHTTWTQKYSRITDGQRLPLEHGLVFHGPVRDFVDIALFVSRDTAGSPELAKLFAQRAASPDLADATRALLDTAGLAALPWLAAVGASAALARAAYELVLGISGRAIGLYRTSFLGREGFGIGRHPSDGLYRAQDFSFSLVIDPVELDH